MFRRAATVTAALLAVGGTPLVAVALGNDTAEMSTIGAPVSIDPTSADSSSTDRIRPAVGPSARMAEFDARTFTRDLDADPLTPSATASTSTAATAATDAADRAAAAAAAEAVAEAAAAEVAAAEEFAAAATTFLLADTYQWDERSPRVVALQEVLGAEADGWYAWATLRAHRGALEAAGMNTDALPVPPAPVAPAPSASSNVASSGGPSASAWAALRNCESGGNYSITNPSGKYRGAYQFDQSTWNSIAGRHAPGLVGVDPAAASPSDQDAMARALYSERGSDPWPQCGRHL
jgi:hypothetical protein